MHPLILLVDDEEEILDFLERMFKSRYSVLRAVSASEALEILEHEVVQLIISDVMMPGMDGFELCRIVKLNDKTSHIPLILLTAKSTMQSKISGLELKADAYIEKPFSKEHLLAQTASLLANRDNVQNYLAGSPLLHLKSKDYSKASQKFLEQLCDVINRYIEDENLGVEILAEKLNMSRMTLYRRIREVSKLTPAQLINQVRLEKAAELLVTKEYKVYEVAMKVGFQSQSNFARNFLRQFKVSPTQFLQSRRNDKEEENDC
ncbi:response regulator [Chitinophaga sp. MM2321]|uniref:response regulator n=1 Tax=Chitinophaga sp. MM2321 TaxID=3137178 RepID=UPI0032D5A52C